MVSTDWLAPEGCSLVNGAGPDVSHGMSMSDFPTSLSLELKHSQSLDVTFQGLMLNRVAVQGLIVLPVARHPGSPPR